MKILSAYLFTEMSHNEVDVQLNGMAMNCSDLYHTQNRLAPSKKLNC